MSARGWMALIGLVLVVLGVRLPSAPEWTPWRGYWPLFIAAGVALLWLVWVSRSGRRQRVGGGRVRSVAHSVMSAMAWDGGSSAARVARMQERSRRNEGLASGWSILRHASGWALRARAGVLRPSLRGRLWVRAIEVGTPLARVGRMLRVWSPCEDVTLRVGGPRTGKSGELACRILDAPGAVIATSTRTDLYRLCGPVLRGERTLSLCSRRGVVVAVLLGVALWVLGVPGWLAVAVAAVALVPVSMGLGPKPREPRPVLVFNPSVTGGVASTVAFNPLAGCADPKTAIERAGDLLQGAALGEATGDREFWVGQARRVLAALMHAAALGGASMRHVQAWLSDPDEHASTVERLLRRSSSQALQVDAAQFFATNDRTRTSITTTTMPALAWLADEAAVACTQPGDGRVALDIEWMLRERAAVFMIGAEEAQTAPLLTALTAHIAREARRIANMQPGGRLDPPLTFVLDEAALICTPPLERWTADMGGLGATIHIGVQSVAQLDGKYGRAGAATILNNVGTLLVFGGTKSPDDLAMYATLTGDREVEAPTWDAHHRRQAIGTRVEPVLSKAQIAGMPRFHALILKKELLPMVGRVEMAWKRPDVKATLRAAAWAARTERVESLTRLLRIRLLHRACRLGNSRRTRRAVAAAQRRALTRGL